MRVYFLIGLFAVITASHSQAQVAAGGQAAGGATGGGGGATGGGGGGLAAGAGFGQTAPISSAADSSLSAPPVITALQGNMNQNTAVLSQSNVLSAYYANPLFQGRAGSDTSTAPGGFGVALYGTTGQAGAGGLGQQGLGTANNALGARANTGVGGVGGFGGQALGGVGGFGGQQGAFGQQAGNFGAFGNQSGVVVQLPRQINYTATLNFPRPAIQPSTMQTNLQSILTNSSMLSSSRNITLTMENNVVVLRGTAANEDDARLAENMLRLTPGVRDVRNEITYPQP